MPANTVPYSETLSDEVGVESPIVASLAYRWAFNWLAAFEGAPGAPRLYLNALERLEPGDNIRHSVANISVGNTFQTLTTFDFIQIGTIRVVMTGTFVGGQVGFTEVIRTRNGTDTVVAGSNQNMTADVDVQPGDRLTLQARSSALLINFEASLRVSNANLWPGSAARLEGNYLV